MKYWIILLLSAVSISLFAQEAEEITDDELERFAIAKDSVDRMTKIVSETIKEMVSSTEAITPSRYNDLYKISKNDEKLNEAEASEQEREFLTQVDYIKDSMTNAIKSTFTELAKDFVGDGGRVYNKVNRAIKSDEEVKARYEAILEAVREESTGSDDEKADSSNN